MKVLKFGGSSVATPERIKSVVSILRNYHQKGETFTVVFSAFGGVTDELIEMSTLAEKGKEEYLKKFQTFHHRHLNAAQALLSESSYNKILTDLKENHEVLNNLLNGIYLVREASSRSMDYVLSFGERNSAFIIAHALQDHGLKASYLDARKIIVTDRSFRAAKVDFSATAEKIKMYYQSHPGIQIVTGFVAAAKGGLTTTLGRGGSDYTAAILAEGLDAEMIEIWTDVDGVLTADPRKVKKAFTIPTMTYAEAMEMSHFGAKVIYPPTIQPALAKGIPIVIKNTFNPEFEGTYISNNGSKNGRSVKGISSISNIALLTLQGSGLFGVPGIAGRLFSSLAEARINIILITQGSSEHSISFAVQPSEAMRAKKRVEKAFEYEIQSRSIEPVKVEDNLAVVAIIGERMRYQPGISGRLFQALGKNGINAIAIAQGSSELNISVVINSADEGKALNALHEAFFLSDTKELHLYMIGVGLIGSTLIKQLKAHARYLKTNRSMELKVVGLANTKTMVFDDNGINLDQWKKILTESENKMDPDQFVQKMKAMNLSNSIFIDNTAADSIAGYYKTILDASISISTPNKIATSSAYLHYKELKDIATQRGVYFGYETNVGAGLPVISTLNDLITSGDRILKIEGVLSGSLSFIFNSFKEGIRFSEIVKEAKKLGYTEPDPRIDLNGLDVRRKIIILAREAGLALEAKDVEIENILPPPVQDAKTIDEFFQQLEVHDDHFQEKRELAAKHQKVLRMIAKLDGTKAKISLLEIDSNNPFYSLSGSDNMIVFTTERYKERPLVIRGPGAGAEVTAAGVFAEIIKIGNYLK